MKKLTRSRFAGVVLAATMAVRCSSSLTSSNAPLVDASMSETVVDAGVRDVATDRPANLRSISIQCSALMYDGIQGKEIELRNADITSPESRGDANAPVKMTWFVDGEDPFGRNFYSGRPVTGTGVDAGARTTFEMIDQEYVSTGRVQVFLKHFPLPFHLNAATYANAVVCAGRQGRAFDMLDSVLRGNEQDPLDINMIATTRGFDTSALQTCMADPTTTARVTADSTLATESRVNAVPWFVFYSPTTERCLSVAGNYPVEGFRAAIEAVSSQRDQ